MKQRFVYRAIGSDKTIIKKTIESKQQQHYHNYKNVLRKWLGELGNIYICKINSWSHRWDQLGSSSDES